MNSNDLWIWNGAFRRARFAARLCWPTARVVEETRPTCVEIEGACPVNRRLRGYNRWRCAAQPFRPIQFGFALGKGGMCAL